MKNILTILILFFLVTGINAQNARKYLSPVASPQASVSQNVGMTNITIKYSSPGVKGRTIFGDLVPYNELWRAGANSPTIIEFSTDVKIGEKTIFERKEESRNKIINEAKNNEKIKMLLEAFDDANLINVQKDDE